MKLLHFQAHISAITLLLSATLWSLLTPSASAEPWVDTANLTLRSEIQYLADRGVISAPVTTYPLMWATIADDLHAANISQLDGPASHAYFNVMNHFNFAKQEFRSVKVNFSNDDNRFHSFGDDFRDKNSLTVNYSNLGYRWAFKLSPSYSRDPDDGDDFRLDGSYVAGRLFNWVFTAGIQDRWWAPGWDTNLSLTNSARPMPGIALTRGNAAPFKLIFTKDYQIPWTVTTFISHMGDDRTIPNALLWGFRFNFKPHKRLEIGITRLAQWAGDGRPSSSSTFWDLLLGRDNCGVSGSGGIDCTNGNQQPGNQQAGYDARLSLPLMGHNIAVYGQSFAEDGNESSTKFWTKARPQIGIDTTLTVLDTPVLAFLEYIDSLAYCGDGRSRGIGDCYYEHSIYRTGLRHEGRTIGSIYDNDATSFVFGLISQQHNDANWQLSIRYAELNKDNSDRYPGAPNGNTLTEISEDMIMLSGKHQRIYGSWKFTLGGRASRSGFKNKHDDNNLSAFLDIEYLL